MGVDLKYVVKRGRGIGSVLRPHKHEDGMYVVSMTRFAQDYVRLPDIESVVDWAKRGYKVRMSGKDSKTHKSPSLISPDMIEGL